MSATSLTAFAAPETAAVPTAEQVEKVAEQYNLARIKVDRANAALEASDRRITEARRRVRVLRDRARVRAVAMYRGAGSVVPVALGPSDDVTDGPRRSIYLHAAGAPDRLLFANLEGELDRLTVERAGLAHARAAVQQNLDSALHLKRKLQTLAAAATANNAFASSGDGAGPVATAPPPTGPAPPAAPAPTTPTTVPTGPTPSPTAPPPPSPPPPTSPPAPTPTPPPATEPPVSAGAGTAVAYARAQLGKPYAFATSGPNSFDCSGLTKAAWAAAGVRMAHYSGSQATSFPRVTWEQLKPGDIVVFYTDLHHVGLYIGGGQMIHAGQTGDVVKIAPAWRTTFMWGVRPR